MQRSQINYEFNILEELGENNIINCTFTTRDTINNNFELLKSKTMVENNDYIDKKMMTF